MQSTHSFSAEFKIYNTQFFSFILFCVLSRMEGMCCLVKCPFMLINLGQMILINLSYTFLVRDFNSKFEKMAEYFAQDWAVKVIFHSKIQFCVSVTLSLRCLELKNVFFSFQRPSTLASFAGSLWRYSFRTSKPSKNVHPEHSAASCDSIQVSFMVS